MRILVRSHTVTDRFVRARIDYQSLRVLRWRCSSTLSATSQCDVGLGNSIIVGIGLPKTSSHFQYVLNTTSITLRVFNDVVGFRCKHALSSAALEAFKKNWDSQLTATSGILTVSHANVKAVMELMTDMRWHASIGWDPICVFNILSYLAKFLVTCPSDSGGLFTKLSGWDPELTSGVSGSDYLWRWILDFVVFTTIWTLRLPK